MDERIAVVAKSLDEGRLTMNPLADGSGVVVDTRHERLWTLNESAMSVLAAVGFGAGTVDDIVSVLQQRFEVECAPLRADVERCLDRLHQTLA